jgi:manganese/zinc/iron transport system substrate-binding protein
VPLLVACQSQSTAEDDGKLAIVTTIAQVADITNNIGGEFVDVKPLMGPGSDPHLYSPSAGDVGRLQSADIVFYNGLFLEAQMEGILEQLGERKTVVAVASNIPQDMLLQSPTYEDEFDPHIWFDVKLWAEATKVIRDTLIEADPEHADIFTANTEQYLAKLEELDSWVKSEIEKLPAEQRVLITAHDAFNYFGRAYGMEVLGLQGISTASEAGTADVQELADYITENKIKAIFVESSVSERNLEAVQAAVASRDWQVEIGGSLFSDAMGSAGTPEGTYIGMVRHNINTIVPALLGE